MGTPLKITAHLVSPLCGEPPHLDALLEWQMARYAMSIEQDDASGRHGGTSEWKEAAQSAIVQRGLAPPPLGILPIGIERTMVGQWPVARCSSPIMGDGPQYVEHLNKRISTNEMGHLISGPRMSIHHGTGATKAYHIPLRIRAISRIVWYCVGYGCRKAGRTGGRRNAASELRRRLRKITAVGQHRQSGYGQVALWDVEPIEQDLSWFAPSEDGLVLMRPLPLEAMEPNTIGWRRTTGACCPPYWHPERYTEVALPC